MRPILLLLPLLLLPVAAQPATPGPGLKYYYPVPAANPARTIEVDVCVYGGTPGGVSAAVQAARMGKKAALVVFRRHVGGMTSGGLTATDIGNREAIGGFAKEFYDRLGKTTGFRPSAAETAFLSFLKEAGVEVYYEHRLKDVAKDGDRIVSATFENGNRVTAKTFVDATYEGDLLAKAGVSFHVGREGNAAYGETINGIQFNISQNFAVKVDPYVIPGDPSSGLLPTISDEPPGTKGSGDKKVQAYCFRFNLSNAPDRIRFPKPEGYDRGRYALYTRYVSTHGEPYPVPFKLAKGDCNTKGGFSTNHMGANYQWPEGDYGVREKIFQSHVNHQQGLAWFASNDADIPEILRERVAAFGLMAGEFPETGGWPHELYVREGRRMISGYVMTQQDCTSKRTAGDSIGLASYNMDSHHCRRIVIDGAVRNEGDVQVRVPKPYPISFRSIVPKEGECSNLFVPVCLSSSHIAYGSIRMEPVFMILGQAAGAAASIAIDSGVPVQKVDYTKLKEQLLANGQILQWQGSVSVPAEASSLPPARPAGSVSMLVENLRAGRDQTLIVYGTSLTLGGSWVPEVKTWLNTINPNAKLTVINSGQSGKNSLVGLQKLDSAVIAKKPATVVIEFSVNDAFLFPDEKQRVSVEDGGKNLEKMVQRIRSALPGTEIIVQTMNPAWDAPNGRAAGSKRPALADYYEEYRKVAAKLGIALIDNHRNWESLRKEDQKKFEAYVPDGVHPSPDASATVTFPEVRKCLGGKE